MDMNEFARINRERCETDFQHKLDEWSLSDWGVALGGECGEALDVIKKLNRIRDNVEKANFGKTTEELTASLAHEIGDIYCYLDLLAQAAGLTLSDCVREKFNIVSDRMGSSMRAPQ